jgi:hypothetical protein
MLRVVPLAAAEKTHRMVSAHKAASSTGEYAPMFFPDHQYQTLRALCDAIIPHDQESGGAVEAGAPEFIDLLTSENKDLQLQFGVGSCGLTRPAWSATGRPTCNVLRGSGQKCWISSRSTRTQRKDPRLSPGIEFFSTLRKYTADGFFTSEIGIKYLGYIGNTYLKEF